MTRVEAGGSAHGPTLDALRRTFEAAGVEFTNGDEPGVKLRKVSRTQTEERRLITLWWMVSISGKPPMPKRSETISAASYTVHYEDRPDASMVRIAPHRYVNDTFLKMSGGSLLASRHGVMFTNGDELAVKLKAKGKRK